MAHISLGMLSRLLCCECKLAFLPPFYAHSTCYFYVIIIAKLIRFFLHLTLILMIFCWKNISKKKITPSKKIWNQYVQHWGNISSNMMWDKVVALCLWKCYAKSMIWITICCDNLKWEQAKNKKWDKESTSTCKLWLLNVE